MTTFAIGGTLTNVVVTAGVAVATTSTLVNAVAGSFVQVQVVGGPPGLAGNYIAQIQAIVVGPPIVCTFSFGTIIGNGTYTTTGMSISILPLAHVTDAYLLRSALINAMLDQFVTAQGNYNLNGNNLANVGQLTMAGGVGTVPDGISAGVLNLTRQPVCRVRNASSGGQVITPGNNVLSWTIADINQGGMFNASSSTTQIVVPSSGVYNAKVQVDIAYTNPGLIELDINVYSPGTYGGFLNVGIQRFTPLGASNATIMVADCGPVELSAGDYFQFMLQTLVGFQFNNGGGFSQYTWASVEKMC